MSSPGEKPSELLGTARAIFTHHERSVRDESASCIPCSVGVRGGISVGREFESRQGLQFRLHLLSGRSDESPAETKFVELTQLLDEAGPHVASGRFRRDLSTPPSSRTRRTHLRRLERHRFFWRWRANHLRNFDEIIAACAEVKRRLGSRRCEDGADHQRQHVSSPARAAWPGNARRKQRRNLGQARSRHRGVLSS